MGSDNPIKGPFPDGDSRNITLTPSDNPYEPDRTGPAEPDHRRKGAPDTVMGELADSEYKQEARPDSEEGEDRPAAEMGFGSVGGAIDPVALGDSEDDPATRVRTDAARPLSGQ